MTKLTQQFPFPVSTRSEAIEKLHRYAQRWKIETFHKILKLVCIAEDAKLRTADRLANLVSILCIVSWRIFWMTMMNRALPDVPATLALTQTETDLLHRLVVDKRNAVGSGGLSHYLNKIARLGGYFDRAHDAPPGNTVMWHGLTRLIYIELGFNIRTELMVIERLVGDLLSREQWPRSMVGILHPWNGRLPVHNVRWSTVCCQVKESKLSASSFANGSQQISPHLQS